MIGDKRFMNISRINTTVNENNFTIQGIMNSNITVTIDLEKEETLLFLGLIYKQLSTCKLEIKRLKQKDNYQEIKYWRTVFRTFLNLMNELIKSNLLILSFLELDCLVGALESEIKQVGLSSLGQMPDDCTELTHEVRNLYDKLLPLYDLTKDGFLRSEKRS